MLQPSRLHTAVCKAAPRFRVRTSPAAWWTPASDSLWLNGRLLQGGRQQDSHELLRCLMGGMQAEHESSSPQVLAAASTGRPESPGHGQTQTGHAAQARSATQGSEPAGPGDASAAGSEARPSLVPQLFEGQLSSRIECQSCKHVSRALEPFQDLSLPIPYALERSHSARCAAGAPACQAS